MTQLMSMWDSLLSRRTRGLLKFDLMRLRARLRQGRRDTVEARFPKLHVGCGSKKVSGWLNVDVAGSDHDVDLGCCSLPWRTDSFDVAVAQQVVEHLELRYELIPLLTEIRRVLKPGAEIWLACPDMEKVCRSYFDARGKDLIGDRRTRFSNFEWAEIPPQHMINELFHQGGEHKNLFDLELLCWTLSQAGFLRCERKVEADLVAAYPEFPIRGDDYSSLYVRAVAA